MAFGLLAAVKGYVTRSPGCGTRLRAYSMGSGFVVCSLRLKMRNYYSVDSADY